MIRQQVRGLAREAAMAAASFAVSEGKRRIANWMQRPSGGSSKALVVVKNNRGARNGMGAGKQSTRTMRQPAASQVRAKNFMHTNFGAAAAHDDFPEGGLRLAGEMPNVKDDSLGLSNTNGGHTGAFCPNLAVTNTSYSTSVIGISPTSVISGTSANTNVLSIFSDTGASNVSSIAQYFRYFRFRRLWLKYEGEAPTSQAGTVQFSYDRDIASLLDNVGSTGSQISAATGVVDRFPWWTPSAVVKLVEDMQCNRADKLWQLTTAGTPVAMGNSNADLEMYFQGGIAAKTDVAETATKQVLGRYRWMFVLDLYGFCPTTADSIIAMRRRRLEAAKTLLHELKEAKAEESDEPGSASSSRRSTVDEKDSDWLDLDRHSSSARSTPSAQLSKQKAPASLKG